MFQGYSSGSQVDPDEPDQFSPHIGYGIQHAYLCRIVENATTLVQLLCCSLVGPSWRGVAERFGQHRNVPKN